MGETPSLRQFLSHLCGEEVEGTVLADKISFLSHLCGEEDFVYVFVNGVEFLSHLCGEEVGHLDDLRYY